MENYPDSEHRRLHCEGCGGNDFDGGDDGFFYCRNCGNQSQDVVDTGWADEDILAASGGLYNFFHHRAQGLPQTPVNAPPPPAFSREDILYSLSRSVAASGVKKEETGEEERVTNLERPYGFEDDEDDPSTSRDLSLGQLPDAVTLADSIRLRYVQGLQVMLQLQCQALVEKFGVSPLICGLAGSIWLRYVASSRVFDEGWAQKVIAESEAASEAYWKAQGRDRHPKRIKAQYRWEPHNIYGQRSIYILSRALRRSLPLYSTLAIAFLVCHIAREAILPTDIYDWASEGKLPYLTAFLELDRHLGTSSSSISLLSSRLLFRPFRVIGSWQIEATTGTIACIVGLCLPSVNFYAIASRYLKDLSLPLKEILPAACHLYEWSIPAELWLSSNPTKLPTRVCVIAILIVTLRILYNVHGQGIWEKTLSPSIDPTLDSHCSHLTHDSLNISSTKKFSETNGNTEECYDTEGSLSHKHSRYVATKEINAMELCILETAYDKICTRHDYSHDLRSYLMYCKDILFAGIPISYDEESLIDRLWDTFEKEEDDDLHERLKEEAFDLNDEKHTYGLPATPLSMLKNPCEEGISDQHSKRMKLPRPAGTTCSSNFISALSGLDETGNASIASPTNDALSQMKRSMDENGFQYLPPRVQKQKDRYLVYPRKKVGGRLIYAAHADYYIILRSFVKLARVDIRLLHLGVRKLERRLAWIEQRIDGSLNSLSLISSQKDMEC